MDLNADIFQADAIAASARARQAEANAESQRQATLRLEDQVAALRSQVEGLRGENQRLQAELDQAMVENVARRAQAKVLLDAAVAADLPVVRGEMPEYRNVFRAAFDAECAARGLPVGSWN